MEGSMRWKQSTDSGRDPDVGPWDSHNLSSSQFNSVPANRANPGRKGRHGPLWGFSFPLMTCTVALQKFEARYCPPILTAFMYQASIYSRWNRLVTPIQFR